MIRRLLTILVSGMLASCQPFSEAEPMMAEYLERLGRVLEVEPANVGPLPDASPIPRRRERLQPLPELELGMLDFLSLYGCELQVVVGQKTSVLGRVMQPINRLRYEVRFIRAAEDCLPEIEDEAFRDELQQAIAAKRDALPIAVWNATWGTEEIERLMTLSKGYYPVAGSGQGVSDDLVRELEQLNRIVARLQEQDLSVSLEALGEIHQRWQAEFRAGQLINSARLLTAYLRAGTETLKLRQSQHPLCLNQRPNNQSEIVESFFFAIYIDKVQRYMSRVSRARYQLIAGLQRLSDSQSAVAPEAFQRWAVRHLGIDDEGSVWGDLDLAMAEHTRQWQQLLGQCGLRPQA